MRVRRRLLLRRLPVLLTAALALAALPLRAARADVDLDREVARLVGPDATQRTAAYTALNRANDAAVIPKLLPVLSDADDIAQYYGVLIIQRFPKRGPPALRKLAAARSPHLRVVAAAALWRAGERGSASTLVKALTAEGVSDAQRATMLMRIYSITDPGVMAAVRGFLTPDGVPVVVQAAAYNVHISRDRGALPALQGLAEHEDAGVRALVGAARLALGDVAGAESLAAALRAGGVDTSALSRVRSILDQAKPAPASVLAAIHEGLGTETNPYALRMLVELLGQHGYAAATKDIRALLEHDNATVTKAAFEALARLPGGITADAMRKLLQEGEDARRLAAADALRRADDASGLSVVLEVLAKGERLEDRWEAARMLGGFRRPEVVPPLLDALADANSSVRSNAWSSLGSVLRALFPYRRLDMGAVGYAPMDDDARRAAGLARLRTWWAKQADAAW